MNDASGRLTPYRQELAATGHCMSDSDGHCDWSGCPQILDGFCDKNGNPITKPGRPHRHCPRDIETRRRLDPDNEGRAGNG
jgi:hypothetical protein